MNQPLAMFAGFGIEIEYMIVQRDSLNALPISDKVLTTAAGSLTSDFVDGLITWSNELVLHVIELKTTNPEPALSRLEFTFHESVKRVLEILQHHDASLMPSAMHPWMNPETETQLWPHDNNEVYEAYNRIFDCRGHGWSNLQSTHINLPFADDREFSNLHSAIRFLLPLMPALTSSSPIVEGKLTGTKNSRLIYYAKNQARIPSIAGLVIPEPVSSIDEYRQRILSRIESDITPHDPDGILREDWLNSRGAIPRFGRQSIEIRILDTQEAPVADISIVGLICAALKMLVEDHTLPREAQNNFSTEELKTIFDLVVSQGESALIKNSRYLEALRMPSDSPVTAKEVWQNILAQVVHHSYIDEAHRKNMTALLQMGSLSSRIENAMALRSNPIAIKDIYRRLCDCLEKNQVFDPKDIL